MINERILSEKFSIIWKQHFPLLTPNFMRVFNEAQEKGVNKFNVPTNSKVRYDLISELSFNIASTIAERKETLNNFFANEVGLKSIVLKTAKDIWKSGNFSEAELVLDDVEIHQSKQICSNILEFIKKMKKEEFQFRPKLRGYGIIPDLTADISIDDTLYEIKTVNRTFRSSDLKQLLIYLALQQVTGERKYKSGGLYNPRKGIYCKFEINSLVYNLSGGKTSNEAFSNLLDSFTRDVQIDSKF